MCKGKSERDLRKEKERAAMRVREREREREVCMMAGSNFLLSSHKPVLAAEGH